MPPNPRICSRHTRRRENCCRNPTIPHCPPTSTQSAPSPIRRTRIRRIGALENGMGTSSKYINPNLYAPNHNLTTTHYSLQRRLNAQPKFLVLPTPPPPNSRPSPTGQRAPRSRNMRHRPPNNNPIPPNALHLRARINRPRLLHCRLRRAHALRLHAHRPTNQPSPWLPTAPRPRR